MTHKLTFFLLLIVLCAPVLARAAAEEEEDRDKEFALILTDEELAFIDDLKAESGIKAATLGRTVGSDEEYLGTALGFHWSLLQDLGALYDIPVTLTQVRPEEVFGDGEQIFSDTEINRNFSPKVFDDYDLVIGNFSPIPWRLRISQMIPVLPNAAVVIAGESSPIRQPDDLDGKRIGLARGMIFENFVEEFRQNQGIEMESVYYDFNESFIDKILSDEIDVSFIDAYEYLISIKQVDGVAAYFPISDIHYLSWLLPKNEPVFSSILLKYLRYVRQNGVYEQVFFQNTRMTLSDYYSLIGFSDSFEIFNLNLSYEERMYIDNLKEIGSIKVAVFPTRESYFVTEDGSRIGFDFGMTQVLGEMLGISIEYEVIENLSDFWARGGTFDQQFLIDNPKVSYTPDLLNSVDFYAGPFSITEIRERLTRMIPMIPVGIIIAGKGASDIRQYTDLENKRFALIESSFQQSIVESLGAQYDFSYSFEFIEANEDPLDIIRQGRADLTLDGAIIFASKKQEMQDMEVSPLVLFKVPIAWVVSKDNSELGSILSKFIDYTLANGQFALEWERHMGMDLNVYLDLIEGNRVQ
jgi:ABC-type amino acid transport substrate-binding protein